MQFDFRVFTGVVYSLQATPLFLPEISQFLKENFMYHRLSLQYTPCT